MTRYRWAAVAVLLTACATSTNGTGTGRAGHAASAPATSVVATPSLPSVPPPTKQPDACSLMTRSEAAYLANTPVNKPVPAGPSGTATLCQFSGKPDGPTAQVQVLVGDGVFKALQIDRDNLKHPFRKLAGFGDEAWEEDDNIFMRKGTLWVQLNLVLLNDPAENRARLEKCAKIVLGRM